MPTKRNGNDSNQTIGHSTSARNASGQHNTSNTHHSIRVIKVFKGFAPFHNAARAAVFSVAVALVACKWNATKRGIGR